MKNILWVGVAALLDLTTLQTFAIGGLQISVQTTNLVLSWPSQGYEQYLVQYRHTLDPSDSWSTFTNAYPANSTNRTTFTIYGVVPAPSASQGGNVMQSSMAGSANRTITLPPVPMVMQANGSGGSVPLALYPPGFDLSGFVIFDPVTGESFDGAGYSTRSFALNGPQLDGPEPMGGGGGTDNPTPEPETGFYQVFHIPNFPASITNYVFDGPIFIPVDFADYRERVENIEVLIDGEPTPYAEYMSMVESGQTNWGMGIYFDRFTNGTHQIQLRSTLHINEEINDNAKYLVLSNLTRTITVANQVTFPDWNDFMQGDTYTFSAQIATPDTDWQIDIYDVWDNYVNSGWGHTTNGQVSWTWDLTDYWGNNRDDFDTDPYFYSYITFNAGTSGPGNGPQSQTTKPTPIPLKGYPNKGDWLVSFQDRWFADAPGYPSDLQGYYDEAVQSVYGGPLLAGDSAQWLPLRFGTNVYSQTERDYSWTNLLAWIGDLHSKNFYYQGHGGPTSIGADRHTLDTNGLVNGSAYASAYTQSRIYSWQVALKTRYNRYRFVFLDGCSTAAGNWPSAFNISRTNHDISFYEGHPKHPRPSVFVGWNQTVGGDGWGNAYRMLDFQKYWMGNWANDFDHPDIETALDRANTGANWVSHNKLWGALQIYGYKQMKMEDYNHKGDWRWP